MTSVQEYLRNLRAARKDFVNRTANETEPGSTAPAPVASPAIATSPWIKSPAIAQPPVVVPQADLGRGEPALAARLGAARATSTPLKPSQIGVRGLNFQAEGTESDTDTDISHLIDQLSLKSALKPPTAPSASVGVTAGTSAPPRRASKMDMLRRKFSASSPPKSWTDLGSSGGAASLGRARTRSRSSVSILDQKIILSGISGDEDSSSSSDATSSSSPMRTESAQSGRRSGRSVSDGEVSEQLEVGGVDSVVPTVPSASSVQTETAPTPMSVAAESVETERSRQESVQTEDPTEESVETESETTSRPASETSAQSKQTRTARSSKYTSKFESDSESRSESESESQSESPVVAAEPSQTTESSESTLLGAAAVGRESVRLREDQPNRAPAVKSYRKQAALADDARDNRSAAKRQKARRPDKAERSANRSSERPCVSSRRDRSPDERLKDRRILRDSTGGHELDRHTRRASRHRVTKDPQGDCQPGSGSRHGGRAKEAETMARMRDDEIVSPTERRRRRRGRDQERERDWYWDRDRDRGRDRNRVRDASWPEVELERTDASESLVVSYQRRVARSAAGCRHCRCQAWPPPPPPPPVTVVVPPASLGVGGSVREAVRLGAAASNTVFVDADEDAVLSAILTQQIVLTRHFLATQKHLHEMYRRALRETQRQVYTHRDDLHGSGHWRRQQRRQQRRRDDVLSD